MERRLAAVLIADVAGYGRLSQADEEGTRTRFQADLHEIFEPKITQHHGRLVKTMGDGLLIEFRSVVDALRCAIEVQRTKTERDTDLGTDRRLAFRIGINLGDVIVEGDDIHGDGVNIADRLQGLAESGGIAISGTAYDQVQTKLAVGFEDLGEQQVKHISKPVRAYRVLMDPAAAGKTIHIAQKRSLFWRWPALTATLLLVVAGAGTVVWLRPWGPKIEAASVTRMALPLPDKPSIAVLPFANMSGEAGQENFADGMTDDLITDLSKVSGLFVIARNSTFVYKGKPVKIGRVAEELGVRYILEGSVRRARDKVRMNAQLIDALTGGHVWADRFDGNVADIFAVQDDFLRKIVEALEVTLTRPQKEEIVRAKASTIAAKEAFDEGWSLYLRFNAKDNARAVGPLKRAIELDPAYGRAYAALAMTYFRAFFGWQKELESETGELNWQDQGLFQDYLKAAKKYPTALAHTAEAYQQMFLGRIEDARIEVGRAIASDPNDPEAHITMAWSLTLAGQPTEALNFVATAKRLNPIYPSHYALAHGIALFAADDLKQAAEVFSEGFRQNPEAVDFLPPLASVLAQLGQRAEARQMLLRWRPETDQKVLERFATSYKFPFRWAREHARVWQRLIEGVQVAALPLDITVSSLMAELKQADPIGRQIAIKRLGWFGSAAAETVPILVTLLDDNIARTEAVKALGKIGAGAKVAIPALVKIQNESVIGSYAKDALKEIRGY
jgi:TolB-like protein/class 3 adenylate cyclase/Flp pilus assembly protein TadD